MDTDLLNSKIIDLIHRRTHPLRAITISRNLKTTRAVISKQLHGDLKNILERDSDYRWSFNKEFDYDLWKEISERIKSQNKKLKKIIDYKNINDEIEAKTELEILRVKEQGFLLLITETSVKSKTEELKAARDSQKLELKEVIDDQQYDEENREQQVEQILSSSNLSVSQKIRHLLRREVDDFEICTMLDVSINQVDREATFIDESERKNPVFSPTSKRLSFKEELKRKDEKLKHDAFSFFWNEANGPLLEMYPDLKLSEIFTYVVENTVESGIKLERGNSEVIKWFKKTQWEDHPVKIVELKNRYVMNSVPYKELRDNGIPKTKTEQIVDYLLKNPDLHEAMEEFDVKEQRIKQVASKFKIELNESEDIAQDIERERLFNELEELINDS